MFLNQPANIPDSWPLGLITQLTTAKEECSRCGACTDSESTLLDMECEATRESALGGATERLS